MKKTIVYSVVFSFFLAGTASAQFFVEEGKVPLSVSGGERINQSITVNNSSAQELNLKVYWEDCEYVAPYDGTKTYFPAGTSKNSASSWIRFVPQELTVPPHGRQKVEYTIDVPKTVEGGHYGVLFFEKPSESVNGTGLSIVYRVGSLFFIEPKNKIKKADVADIKFDNRTLNASFSNSGNVVLIPRISYYIMNDSGLAVERGEIPLLYVPPGAAAPWKFDLPVTLGEGRFSLVLNVDLGEGDLVVKEITFSQEKSGSVILEKIQD